MGQVIDGEKKKKEKKRARRKEKREIKNSGTKGQKDGDDFRPRDETR